MPEKVKRFTDPAALAYDGVDRIKWVEMDGGVAFTRRSGKAVGLYGLYRKADANSSTLAGFLELAEVGTATSDITSVSSNDKLPVNFGLEKTFVMPTSNRAAVEADRGRTFDIILSASGVQYINMAATAKGILSVSEVIDSAGAYVSVRIPTAKRYGNL